MICQSAHRTKSESHSRSPRGPEHRLAVILEHFPTRLARPLRGDRTRWGRGPGASPPGPRRGVATRSRRSVVALGRGWTRGREQPQPARDRGRDLHRSGLAPPAPCSRHDRRPLAPAASAGDWFQVAGWHPSGSRWRHPRRVVVGSDARHSPREGKEWP